MILPHKEQSDMENREALADLLQPGNLLKKSGDFAAALASYELVRERFPDEPEAHCRCAEMQLALGRKDAAEESYRRALALSPAYPEAACGLGGMLVQRREWGEAEASYRKALAGNPDHPDLHVALGDLLARLDRNTEACYFMRRAVAIRPESAAALNGLGFVLRCMEKYDEAEDFLRRAIAVDDRFAQAWCNLAICNLQRGRLQEAADAYRKAIALEKKYANAWDGLLLMSHYRMHDRNELFRMHCDYGALFPQEPVAHTNVPDRTRRLRIGFVSGDFRQHSVGYFILSILSKLDRRSFELWAYYTYPTADYRTESFRRLFTRWRPVFGLSDSEFCTQVRDDRVDILVDLSGHTGHNRLTALARKPAPVQVSWIGYPDTTGLAQIDYRLTDAYADPAGVADQYHVERLWRLPRSFLCYTPPEHAPEVSAAPCLKRGFITFGSFSTRMKIGAECIALWARVLHAVPESRLLLKSAIGFQDDGARAFLRAQFADHGIAADRIEVLAPKHLLKDHLAAYEEIDIVLDTTPYHGTTTTCEALWMGVPVVSLAGDRHVSRVGVSLLSNAGLEDLVADGEEEYVEIAAQLASDFQNLGLIRGALRAVLKNSRLLDEAAMARDFADAMRSMWHRYCDEHPVAVAACGPAAGVEVPAADVAPAPRLLIGGTGAADGWKVFAAEPGDGVDYDGDLLYLHRFGDEGFSEIYCAHVVQRLGLADVADYLKDLCRMLVLGGRLYLSVPDLDALAWMLASPVYDQATRFGMMRALFGGQMNMADFNHVGLNLDFLRDYLQEAGFDSVERVASFGLFADASEARVDSIPISLNLIAVK
ncbi:tetratricopeptide repeat protein [Azospira restricta]|nr:tetratricopeptide repeat protein [Azospira restricta]